MISKQADAKYENNANLDINKLDRFVKITDAARLLGYSSYQSVKKLVDDNVLNAYSLPQTSRPRILLSELLELRSASENQNFLPKRERGRPRKYVGSSS